MGNANVFYNHTEKVIFNIYSFPLGFDGDLLVFIAARFSGRPLNTELWEPLAIKTSYLRCLERLTFIVVCSSHC